MSSCAAHELTHKVRTILTSVVSNGASKSTGSAFHTASLLLHFPPPAICSRYFHSCSFHPCFILLYFPLLHFHPCIFDHITFSTPTFSVAPPWLVWLTMLEDALEHCCWCCLYLLLVFQDLEYVCLIVALFIGYLGGVNCYTCVTLCITFDCELKQY